MIGICGAGAFGTALAAVYARAGRDVCLWARDAGHRAAIEKVGENSRYLPGAPLPPNLRLTSDLKDLESVDYVLLALPMRALAAFLTENAALFADKTLIACSKGVDPDTLLGPSALIARHVPQARIAVLTGPSFAVDIVAGQPTALCLAMADMAHAQMVQAALSTPQVRLYRSQDVIGAELGGALKNVIAIACGATMGAKLGESARAAILTRGFAEMCQIAAHMGAEAQTLSGLSGLGDLTLSAMSPSSRNYRFGYALGAQQSFDAAITVEGARTAYAIEKLALRENWEVPICHSVVALIEGRKTVSDLLQDLSNRPLKEE